MEQMSLEGLHEGGQVHHRRKLLGFTALFLIILFLVLFFAPAQVHFVEVVFNKGIPTEIMIRIYFLLFSLQLILLFSYGLYVRPAKGLRPRLVLYFLLVEELVLCSIWVLDAPGTLFHREGSSVTFCTSVVLILCAGGMLINLLIQKRSNPSGKMSRVFLGLASCAFLFAGIDEYFMIHEKVAEILQAPSWGQDLITVAYAVGAACFMIIFYRSLRKDLLDWSNYFPRLLTAGILSLAIAMFLDTANHAIDDHFGRHFDLNHLCNALEEWMEFTAAFLFCCAAWIGILEANQGKILKYLEEEWITETTHPVGKAIVVTSFSLFVMGLLTVHILYGKSDLRVVIEDSGCTIIPFADYDDGLRRPDGLLFSADYGLIVCNEGAGELLAFDSNGQGRVLVNARSGLDSPEGVAVNSNGIYVSDDRTHKILHFSDQEDKPNELFSEALESPEGLAIDDRGRLYIADEDLSMIIRQTGHQREILASSFDGLMTPEEMAFDKAGNLFVTDESARSIFKIDPAGVVTIFADESDGLSCPEGIVVHEGRIYVTDEGTGRVYRFEPDGSGEIFLRFGAKYCGVSGIAFDDHNTLYLVAKDIRGRNPVIFSVEL